MEILVIILVIIIAILTIYILLLGRQFKSINKQLENRLIKHTKQPVSVEFIHRQLEHMVVNINNCLKAEEILRLNGIREEKHFKELIANISHDLRTPLTAIKGYLQMLHKDELLIDQQMKLDVAVKYAEEMEQLISRFFEYSYLLTAENELTLEKINLTNLVTECLAEAVPAFEEQHLLLCYEEPKAIFIRGDKESLLRIIRNLIRNCNQHGKISVEVSLSAVDKQAVLAFCNYIDGNLELDPSRVFERFYTADKARGSQSGLGLSIVKILTERMGGNVSAALEQNKLTLRIKLPLLENGEKE